MGRQGSGGPSGLQSRQGDVAHRLEGSIPSLPRRVQQGSLEPQEGSTSMVATWSACRWRCRDRRHCRSSSPPAWRTLKSIRDGVVRRTGWFTSGCWAQRGVRICRPFRTFVWRRQTPRSASPPNASPHCGWSLNPEQEPHTGIGWDQSCSDSGGLEIGSSRLAGHLVGRCPSRSFLDCSIWAYPKLSSSSTGALLGTEMWDVASALWMQRAQPSPWPDPVESASGSPRAAWIRSARRTSDPSSKT